ncbi:hypothetical protein [Niastella sp. OAS944]|uniref:hypothetical protein n=1 Tax=Niastella sp. OAS944 TaxID=2664089 RepID=UPI003470A255|nr:hypothetical protein [Chitinophagaceae bacterium OAS944]
MNCTFKKIIIFLIIVPSVAITAVAQKQPKKASQEISIPMDAAHWKHDTTGVEFTMEKNVKAIRIKNASPLVLKDIQFANGTIEYDVALGQGFPGINFHLSDDGKNGEHFYLRYFGSTSPESRTTLQYSALIDGMSIWDLTDEYQAGAKLNIPTWNHVKLVLSGKQMKAYVNDMSRPALVVPKLEGGRENGGISFSGGEVAIANVVLKPDVVENLDPAPGYISSYNDTRYLRNWQVSKGIGFEFGKEIIPPIMRVATLGFPDSTTEWTNITAEDRGIVNLTRLFGATDFKNRRLAWLKTTIESDKVQERMLNLGFSDEVCLFINGQFLYSDKNHFGTPGQKFPRGRCTIENAAIKLPLQKGKNEILIGLTNYFYGWGIIARLDDTDGIHLPVIK